MADEQKNVEVPKETKPAESTPTPPTETHAVESKPAEETPADSAPATEDKPGEEGHLGHKAQGLNFPKNLIASHEFFFGTDAFEPKALAHYLKTEKSAETAHSNIAWASHTGQGLLFVGDKKNPSSIINLADATEPEADGSHKFHFISKGNKHSFKAANTAERDNWVAQLKLKIAEAKGLAATITESEAYKKTIESFKPAPPKKEEKAAETPKEEEPKEERKKEEAKPAEETPAAEITAETTEPAAEAEALKTEEAKPPEENPAESPKEKPATHKLYSFISGVFSKKKSPKVKPTEPAEAPNETAPVISPVEATTPLTAEVSRPATGAAETSEAAPATNGETKKEHKEKRKSSLPFAFGKHEKSLASAEGEEKSVKSPFSKLRASIKGKAKAEEKPAEETKPKEEAKEAKEEEPARQAEPEVENKRDNVASPTLAVTAAT